MLDPAWSNIQRFIFGCGMFNISLLLQMRGLREPSSRGARLSVSDKFTLSVCLPVVCLYLCYFVSLSVFRSVCISVYYSDCLHLQISSVCLFSCMCLPNFLFLSVCPAKFTLSVFLPVVAKFTLPVYFTLYLQKFTMTFRQFQSFCFSICLYVSAKLSLSVCLSVSANCLDCVSVFFVVSLCQFSF